MEAAEKLLTDIGVPHHLDGRVYLECILSNCQMSDIRKSIVRGYEVVSTQHDVSSARVERGIRYAKEWVIDNGVNDAFDNIFGNTVRYSTGGVTNKHFILGLMGHLKNLAGEGRS